MSDQRECRNHVNCGEWVEAEDGDLCPECDAQQRETLQELAAGPGVMAFAYALIDAHETGFMPDGVLSLAQIFEAARDHVRIRYNHVVPLLFTAVGAERAQALENPPVRLQLLQLLHQLQAEQERREGVETALDLATTQIDELQTYAEEVTALLRLNKDLIRCGIGANYGGCFHTKKMTENYHPVIEVLKRSPRPLAGQLRNLNGIAPGTRLEFARTESGTVAEVHKPVKCGQGVDLLQARLVVEHQGGAVSYHTYRRDGRSHQDSSHDIVRVTPSELPV